MPIKSVTIDLGAIDYPGWYVKMRTNPRASLYDDLVSLDEERWWPAFGKIVLEWNLADEDGQPFQHPSKVDSEKALDLPVALITYVFSQYIDEVRAAANLPKALNADSSTTLSTSDGSPNGG